MVQVYPTHRFIIPILQDTPYAFIPSMLLEITVRCAHNCSMSSVSGAGARETHKLYQPAFNWMSHQIHTVCWMRRKAAIACSPPAASCPVNRSLPFAPGNGRVYDPLQHTIKETCPFVCKMGASISNVPDCPVSFIGQYPKIPFPTALPQHPGADP